MDIFTVLWKDVCAMTGSVLWGICFAHAAPLYEKLHAVHTMLHSHAYNKHFMWLSGQTEWTHASEGRIISSVVAFVVILPEAI